MLNSRSTITVIDTGTHIHARQHPTPPPTALDMLRHVDGNSVEWTASRVINPGNTETCIYRFDN